MKLAVDTNVYTAVAKGDDRQGALLRAAERVFLPFIVVAELRAGFAAGTMAAENEATLQRFINSPRVKIAYADGDTTIHYARLLAWLRKAGRPVPTNDLWIAALCVQHGLTLATLDNHFSHIPGLSVV